MSTALSQPSGPLPTCRRELSALGWSQLDVVIITGSAYVDHPAFGDALLGRWLISHGYRTGIVAQPRWDVVDDLLVMGAPRLFVGVSAGALDSMLAHYTAFRKKRRDDVYTPGGRAGARPNRAAVVYANLARRAFPGIPVVLGGVEASLRRAVHYDFWSNSLRRPVLLDGKAQSLVYGMAESALLEIAGRLDDGKRNLIGIPGTVCPLRRGQEPPEGVEVEELPSLEEIREDPQQLIEATKRLESQVHRGGPWLLQRAQGETVLIAPPSHPLTTSELDRLYGLPFTREAHPSDGEPIPALEMIRFSVTSHRGCAGGCSFCSLALHQGRQIRSRSRASLRAEVEGLAAHGDWKGSITDVGGPSANMWGARCRRDEGADCGRASCLFPRLCRHFDVDQGEIVEMLRALARVKGVRHLRVASGVRHDLALRSPKYLEALVTELTGGQLKIAPEHLSDRVLALARKPGSETFERFVVEFERRSHKACKEQYLVPYLLSALPGSTDRDMRELARWFERRRWSPRQVQCFVPTPGTMATAMFFAGADTKGRPIHVARTDAERLRQHGILTGQLGKHQRKRDGRPKRRRGR